MRVKTSFIIFIIVGVILSFCAAHAACDAKLSDDRTMIIVTGTEADGGTFDVMTDATVTAWKASGKTVYVRRVCWSGEAKAPAEVLTLEDANDELWMPEMTCAVAGEIMCISFGEQGKPLKAGSMHIDEMPSGTLHFELVGR